MAMNQGDMFRISRSDMTPVLANTDRQAGSGAGEGDIPISEINMIGNVGGGGGNFGGSENFPQVLPNNPTFTVPANPLLPEDYSEILDYNSLQFRECGRVLSLI